MPPAFFDLNTQALEIGITLGKEAAYVITSYSIHYTKLYDERFSLAPVTSFTLHLEMDEPMPSKDGMAAWQNNARQGLELLVPALEAPAMVGLETLWYPPDRNNFV